MDPVCHAAYGENTDQYIAKVVKSVYDQSTMPGNNGKIAILGATTTPGGCGGNWTTLLNTKFLTQFETQKQKDIENGEVVSAGLDGLLERIKLAHHIAGFWISLFITLLFMAIEMTPIFFKLMLVKSPYDFLKENVEELMKAEQGIHIEYNYHMDFIVTGKQIGRAHV